MAEEKDNKQKPKATLIKHKKAPHEEAPSQEEEESQEKKKKKVKVKKRVVVVKKSGEKEKKEEKEVEPHSEKQHEESKASSEKQEATQHKTTQQKDGSEKKPHSTQKKILAKKKHHDNAKTEPKGKAEESGRSGGRSSNNRSSDNKKQDSQRRRDTSQGRGGGYQQKGKSDRPGGGQQNRYDKGKPRDFQKGRDSGKPAPPTPAPEEQQKPSHKKFKTKKKEQHHKSKKEEQEEKAFQLKKRKERKTNPVPKKIDIMEVISVSELAKKMNLKASELISKLMKMGVMATINQQIDADTAALLADEYGCEVKIVSLYDETLIENDEEKQDKDIKPRPPIVTVMGHVDHGKTKLLDAIRTTDVVDSEYGGITQHIGAYTVDLPQGSICFLDTPGHEAFTLMRSRGAQLTDIVVLVVAANDGVKPQTIEAISHAKDAGVPIIVAINKIDLQDANLDQVKRQLADHNLMPESWGGDTLFNEISALKKMGIEELLENILLQAEYLELKANYNARAEGKIIESKVDHGRGIVSSVIVEKGTLRVGDPFVAGIYSGKVRAMFDDKGKKITEATPATPVEILGFTGIPNSGDPFQATENERIARQVGSKRQELKKMEEAKNVKKVTLDNLYDSIQEGEIQELKVIIKGDVHGSVEALQTALEKLSTKEIKLNAIHASAGTINESDVMLASASNAIIIGFHVRPTPQAANLAEEEHVEIRKYNIIYDAVNEVRDAMEGMLKPDIKEETIGLVEVRDTFKVPKAGLVAGCYVLQGKVTRNANVHVIRDGIQIYTSKISTLKRFKEDAKQVETGYECGISLENYNDIKVGDQYEVYEIKEIAKSLDGSQK